MTRRKTKAPTETRERTETAPAPVREASTIAPVPASDLARAHARFGWTGLFIAMAFGLALEGLLGFKAISYLEDPLRRELWTLAHFHGALLSVLNLVYVRWASDDALPFNQRRPASRSLMLGSILIPAGFLLGGIGHPEGDPGIGIFAVPAGALLLLYAIGLHALAAWRR